MIKVNDKGFRQALAGLQREIPQHNRQLLMRAGHLFVAHMIRTRHSGRPGLNSSSNGEFENSLQSDVAPFPGGQRLVVFYGVPYARIHESGGTIRPTKRQWLTIPLGAAKTAGGALRGGALSFDNTFFIRSRKGNLLIVREKGAGNRQSTRTRDAYLERHPAGVTPRPTRRDPSRPHLRPRPRQRSAQGIGQRQQLELLFVLKKEVTIPPRLGFGRTWRAWSTSELRRIVDEARQRLIQQWKAGRG